jgi:hypothetical protein
MPKYFLNLNKLGYDSLGRELNLGGFEKDPRRKEVDKLEMGDFVFTADDKCFQLLSHVTSVPVIRDQVRDGEVQKVYGVDLEPIKRLNEIRRDVIRAVLWRLQPDSPYVQETRFSQNAWLIPLNQNVSAEFMEISGAAGDLP